MNFTGRSPGVFFDWRQNARMDPVEVLQQALCSFSGVEAYGDFVVKSKCTLCQVVTSQEKRSAIYDCDFGVCDLSWGVEEDSDSIAPQPLSGFSVRDGNVVMF